MRKTFKQVTKFVPVGFLNTAIDFVVLNFLMWATGIYAGFLMLLFKALAFLTANLNSYFCNKYWTFGKKESTSIFLEYGKFLSTSLGALVIHLVVIYGLTTFVEPILVGPELWANGANILAVGLGLIWNFIGYKFFVFRE